VGGDEMDDAIVNFCKREHQLLIGHQTAEDIKHEAGSAAPLSHEVEIEIRGRDLGSGLPRAVKLNSEDVRKALDEPIAQIIAAVRDTLDRTPPELAGDLMERGMILAGGGALIQGMAERMGKECQVPATLADSPLTCVATGSGQALEEFEAIKRALKNSRVRRRF
jgi:rod shape-determining protein MreB